MNKSPGAAATIFDAALQLSPDGRAAYLDQACAGDAALRRRVEALLGALEAAGTFMEKPATPARPARSPLPATVSGAPSLSPESPAAPDPADDAVGQTVGRYKLLERIGEGGCGAVYLAEQTEPVRRRVALKLIKLGMDTRQVIARFEAERQALAMMDHPNIAKVLDAGTTEGGKFEVRDSKGEGDPKGEVRSPEPPACPSDFDVRPSPLPPDFERRTSGFRVPPGRPYFVMELVRGVPITQYCDQAQLTTHQRLELFIKVCQAIQHAHQKGIIHRDIKPSNILVTRHDGVPVPKVIDFGIAKAIEGRLTDGTVFTQFQQFIGTPAYMSPEQAELTGLDIDTRSDIYSLGVLLYELLAGSTPFDAQELVASGLDAMRKAIREQDPPRPSTRLTRKLARLELGSARASRAASGASPEAHSSRPSPDEGGREDRVLGGAPKTAREVRALPEELRTLISALRGDLDWIVMKCLEKDRTRRYETANGLALDLKRHLDDEPVLARPPSAAYRFQKAFRRHRLVFTAATVVALALVAGIGVSTWQTFAARKAQRETEAARKGESEANELLRVQMGETEGARRSAEQAARSEGEARRQAEGALQRMQVQKAEELLATRESGLGVGYLGRVLRANPSNEVAAARLAAAMLQPFARELTGPLQDAGPMRSAQFSPDGSRVVTAGNSSARVWDALTGQPATDPLPHKAWLHDAQFSPNGVRVVTASADSTARVWDARTGQPATPPLPHGNQVISAEFSPDGSWVVTASLDHTARVWDARTGEPVTGPLQHEGGLGSAHFSPDGLRVATASGDGTTRVWDARTGQPRTEPFRHGGGCNSARFSPDGLRLVTASDDGTARVWDARTGQPLTQPFRHPGRVLCAEFSPDGLRVVTGSDDNTARLWDPRTGQAMAPPLPNESWVHNARFSPDGLRVVTAANQSARVWDARTGQPVTEPLRHLRKVVTARFSPDGLQVVTASEDRTARVWDVRSDPVVTEPLGHGGRVRSAQFSPDGSQVVTASDDATARLWDAQTGQPLLEPLRHEAGLKSARFSRDGLRVATASLDQTARVWDARTGQPLTPPLRHKGNVWFAEFSPDGSRVATASEDRTARVWDSRTGEPVTGPLDHGWEVESVEFSPDGLQIATASLDGTARVWDARTGQPVTGPLRHDGLVVNARFSPDGSRVVTAGHDYTARVWDARTGQPLLPPLPHANQVNAAQFSPDGSRIVTASWDKTARVWDARTGQPLTEPLPHAGTVWSAEFSPDGLRVATVSLDQTARVWDASTGQPVTGPLQHAGEVHSAQFSPDGSRVLTASWDGTARVWDVRPPSLPVPGWFLDWAEARVGRRFAAADGTEAISFAEQERQREQVRSRTDTNFFTRLAQWVEADPTTRTLSPNAVVTMPEHVRRLMDANTVASLREALALSPTESLAWGRLALHLATGEGEQNSEDRLTEAEWDARLALKLDPQQPEARRALETVRSLRP